MAPGKDNVKAITSRAAAEEAQEKLQMARERFLAKGAIWFLPKHRKAVFAKRPVRGRGRPGIFRLLNGGKPGENAKQRLKKGLLAAKICETAKQAAIFKRPGPKRRVPKETIRSCFITGAKDFHQ